MQQENITIVEMVIFIRMMYILSQELHACNPCIYLFSVIFKNTMMKKAKEHEFVKCCQWFFIIISLNLYLSVKLAAKNSQEVYYHIHNLYRLQGCQEVHIHNLVFERFLTCTKLTQFKLQLSQYMRHTTSYINNNVH